MSAGFPSMMFGLCEVLYYVIHASHKFLTRARLSFLSACAFFLSLGKNVKEIAEYRRESFATSLLITGRSKQR
jgi:hypothetical protein